MVQSFREVIDRLGGVTAFADAIGMKPNAAKMARQRNSISADWFADIARVAAARELSDITLERLIEMTSARRKAREAA